MALYLIGLGLGDENDITLKGLDAIKKCQKIYLETYTSKLANFNVVDMEKLYGKKIILADRKKVEEDTTSILSEAKKQDTAVLIIGSPFSATTHIELLLEAHKKNVHVYVIENASVLTAVGITGLFLYKFGKTATILFPTKHIEKPYELYQDLSKPAKTSFDTSNITGPYEIYNQNQQMGLHTLFLLDIEEDKMMTVREGLDILLQQGLPKKTLVVGCGALGLDTPEIRVGAADNLALKKFPQCFIIPGKLNFKEEEALNLYRK